MRAETKILLEEYKSKFKKYKDFLDKNDWVNEVTKSNKGALYSDKLSTELAIVETILKSMNKFKDDVGDDMSLKVVKDFVNQTVLIIKKHISKIDLYEKQNPIKIESGSGELEEFNFQTNLFQNKIKSKIALSKLDIDEDSASKKSLDIFYGNGKAPLMMRDYLYDKYDIIKNKTDSLGIDFSVPHINPATSNELLINMKSKDIPPWIPNKHFFEQEKSTIQFWEEEKRKIKNGINIGGYHLSGWLYWHTNIFKLNYGAEDEKDIKVALFRDNEYFFDYMYNKAKSPEYGRHGLFLYGTRRYSKSSGMSSRLLYGLWTIKNANATVQGFSKVPDLEALINYSSDAISEMYPALRIPANSLTLDDGIVLGLKDKKAQERLDFSKLSIVNLEGGNTKKGSQKTAGSTPDIFLLDEALHEQEMVYLNNEEWIPIKDVKVGDMICNEEGTLTKVLKKIDVGVVDIWEFTLSDGRKIKSSSDHNWKVYSKKSNKYLIKTTNEIIEDYKKENKNGFVYNYSIPATKAIQKSKKNLGIDPYWLGLYLGDGLKGSPTICSEDDFIINYCIDYAKRIGADYSIRVDPVKSNGTFKYIRINQGRQYNSIIDYLRKYNTFYEKRIPEEYLDSCIEDRMELLRGLFDSDAYSDKTGRVEFNTSYIPIYEGMKKLLLELGILFKVDKKKSTYTKNGQKFNGLDTYRFQIYTYEKVFKLERKLKNIVKKPNVRTLRKDRSTIKDINKLNKAQAYCIQVDNETSLFLTTDCIVTKNCGKGKSIPPWKAAMPSFAGGKNGKWRLVPMLSGTAGEGALSVDAEAMLKDPKGYSIMPMDWDHLEEFVDPDYVTWDRNTFGFFVPAQMSLEAPDKIIKPFGDFLSTGINTKKLDLNELNKLNIHVTDWKEAKEFFEQKRENVKNDLSLLAGETNSFPLTPEDCYVSSEKNKYPGLECKNRRKYVEDHGLQGQKVWLVKNGDRIDTVQTNDPIITEYPYKGGNFDAPIVILDDPYNAQGQKPPLGLYCIGFDDVKQEKSSGDSVMSATVFKRSYEQGEWANRIVAYYDSRPERKKDYYRNLYLLIKFYNARILHENEDNSFVEYMEDNHMDEIYTYLSDGVGLATEENLNRNKNRKFGWSPTPLNIYNLEQTMVMYTKEEGVKIGEEEGLTGVDRINHPMLLEEFYKYKKDLNADRLRSFGLALKLARYYDKTNAYMKFRNAPKKEETTYKKKKTIGVKGFTFTNKLKKY